MAKKRENVTARRFIELYMKAKNLAEFQSWLKKENNKDWTEEKILARIASLRTDKKVPLPSLADRQAIANQKPGQKAVWATKATRKTETTESLTELIPKEFQVEVRKGKKGKTETA